MASSDSGSRATEATRLAFTLEEYRDRLRRTRDWMRAKKIDLLLLHQPEHYHWLSGYEPTSTFYYQALIVPVDDRPLTLLCNKAELLLCQETCWVSDVRTLWTHEDQVARTMEILTELDLLGESMRVGLNFGTYYLRPMHAFGLQKALAGRELVDVSPGIDDLRLVKSQAEIDLLRRAAYISDIGVTAGINAIRPGATDNEVMAAIQGAVTTNGGQFPAYPGLVDARGTLHGTPIGKRLADGDVIYLEVDGVVRRYHTNISRTVVVGQPSRRVRELHELVNRTYVEAVDAMRPGVNVTELVELVGRAYKGREWNTWGRFGFSADITFPPHWIGALSLMNGDTHVLEPGMVIIMEPGLAYDEGVTMGLGSAVLVTDGAPEILNNTPTDLFVR